MSKHTPGPWTVGVTYEGDQSDLITADDGTKYHRRRAVARVATQEAYRDVSAAQADARLIAAAPELLEALKELLRRFTPRDWVSGLSEAEKSALGRAGAAIAKAEGRE